MFEDLPYQKPLVVGTGGGNDIVSATMIVADLRQHGKQADLAGICSPGAWHAYGGVPEAPINRVSSRATRFRQSKTIRPISFLDARVPGSLQKQGLEVKVYNWSCRFGTEALTESLDRLMKQEGYDGIIAVDVGGDILARGIEDPTILSPLMDFTTLHVLGQLEAPSTLVEFGLQTDGELRPEGCEQILADLESRGILKDVREIQVSDPAVDVFRRVYQDIEKVRRGHTAVMTFQTWEAKEDIHTDYRFRVQVSDKKWYHSFPLVLEKKYFRKAFILDPKGLAKTRPLAFPYADLLELYVRMKSAIDTKTEMDMLYWQGGSLNIWTGLLCPQIEGEKREQILRYGAEQMDSEADVGLFWEKDKGVLQPSWSQAQVGSLVAAGKETVKVSAVASKLEKIMSVT
ncbi:MAG: DUF1152 domain-containing protein [Nanoarchaeota archaeon]